MAALLVLVGLYSALQEPGVVGFQPSSSAGAVGLSEVARGKGDHARDHAKRDDADGDEGRAQSLGAAARAGARSQGIAEAEKIAAAAAAAASEAEGEVSVSAAESGAVTGAPPASSAPPPLPATRRAGASGVLSWAPPAGYAGYPVKKVSGAGVLNTVDAGGGDVSIQLSPAGAVGPVVIKNCRNAVLIGGQIDVAPTAELGGSDQRGIYVNNCTGVVHIEGVVINGAVNGSEADGIAVNAPKAVVQIQNVRVEGMRGGKSGNHADVFQPWGGVREYRIDRLTGSTNYQGLHVGVDLGPIGRGTVTNTNISSSEVGPVDKGGQFIWLDCNAYPLTLDNVYIAGRSDRSFGTSVWPQPDTSGCPATISAGVASWPGYSSLIGSVRDGLPASGDFVPAGSVGLGYVSPGYL